MKIVFYKCTKGNIFDKLIGWWTAPFKDKFNGAWKNGFSHVELQFSDGTNFSASQYEGVTRFRRFVTPVTRWVMIDLPLNSAKEQTVRNFCTSVEGCRYDYQGILGFVIGTPDDKQKWFCSEVVSEALMRANIIPKQDSAKISPNKLYVILKEIMG